MNESATILIIDDEVQIRRLLVITLETQGFSVMEAATAKEGIALAASNNPSLVLLDLGLPDMDGLEVLQRLREFINRPVIILSVRKEEESIIHALDHGANDYITKPFRTGELMARIRSALRHSKAEPEEGKIDLGEIEIDLGNHTVRKNSEPVHLTSTEFNLLSLFARNSGKVLTHQYILREIWGPGYQGQSQYLRVYIAQLRKKLENDPSRPVLLVTESGIGYRMAE
ncbi:MAG TPA: response regulator [Bacteroidales bacterium]|nr:response regulator [Bacteroidales bacterium]